jgi:glycosyltransferase involved in cell wall biosynthesis
MHLAIEVTTCTAHRTGVGYYVEHLVDALLETREPGDSLTLLSNQPPAAEIAARWAPFLRVDGSAGFGSRGAGFRAVWMQTRVPRLLEELGADIALFPNYVVALASPCPTMVVVHDLALLRLPQHFTRRKRLVMRSMLHQSVASAAVVATLSEASRRDIIDRLGIPPERIELLPAAAHPWCAPAAPAVVAAARARYGLGRNYVLSVGTLEPRKNLMTLLRAFDRLGPDASAHDLVVVGGRGWRDRDIVRALDARRTHQRVHWLGYVPEADLTALYTGADALVYASTLEGFGLPVVEGMACGVPVIASDLEVLREVAGDAARFVPPGDEVALARAIADLLRDPDAASRAREAGIARASRFSWTRTAAALWARARRTTSSRVRPESGAGGRPREDDRSAAQIPPVGAPPRHFGAREWALLATVAYADLFDSPLPVEHALSASFGAVFDEAELRRMIQGSGLSTALVLHPSGNLVLAGREALLTDVEDRKARTREVLDRHHRILAMLATLPFVRMLALSGGAAHNNLGPRADIDLFVVAAADRAYTAFTLLFLAAKLTGTRGVMCPNYMVDERELAIAYHHDLFTAHQLVSARPLSGLETYAAFCRANEAWVRRFFPGFVAHSGQPELGDPGLQRALERILAPACSVLEGALRWGWRFRLRRRAARSPQGDVVLGDGVLKLHLSDYRRTVLYRFAGRLDELRAQFGKP